MKLGLVGYGAVAARALEALASESSAPLEALTCLARPDGGARARELLARHGDHLAHERRVVATIDELLATGPDLVVEAAGHEALRAIGPDVLAGGVDLVITSVGALAHDALRDALDTAATRGGARYHICAGAVGGFDILAAARLSGLEEVVYTSRKPPAAWRGTRAQALVDLENLRERRTFFRGNAGEAARDYPQNANVAATIALRGVGLDKTMVELIADPVATRNIHEIRFRSRCADVSIVIEGNPSPENPKTSMTTGYALASQIIDFAKARTRAR